MTQHVWEELCAVLREGSIEPGPMPEDAVDLDQHIAHRVQVRRVVRQVGQVAGEVRDHRVVRAPVRVRLGQVATRQKSPSRTRNPTKMRFVCDARSMAYQNMLATFRMTSSAVVVTSRVPMRNQPSRARRSGMENW